MSEHYEDAVRRVLRLMEQTFGTSFKTYYDGDSEAIPLFNLPAIIVTQTGDTTTAGAMGEDDITEVDYWPTALDAIREGRASTEKLRHQQIMAVEDAEKVPVTEESYSTLLSLSQSMAKSLTLPDGSMDNVLGVYGSIDQGDR